MGDLGWEKKGMQDEYSIDEHIMVAILITVFSWCWCFETHECTGAGQKPRLNR